MNHLKPNAVEIVFLLIIAALIGYYIYMLVKQSNKGTVDDKMYYSNKNKKKIQAMKSRHQEGHRAIKKHLAAAPEPGPIASPGGEPGLAYDEIDEEDRAAGYSARKTSGRLYRKSAY